MTPDMLSSILARRSIRAFKSDSIDKGVLEILLEAARWAPSAGNLQAREIVVVRDRRTREQLSAAALGQRLVAEAPIDFVVCACPDKSARRYGERGRSLYCILDAAASIQNMLLAAHSLGLGTCWIGAFEERMVTEILKLSSKLRPVAIVPTGYPAESPTPTSRLSLNEFVYLESYGEPYR